MGHPPLVEVVFEMFQHRDVRVSMHVRYPSAVWFVVFSGQSEK